MKKSKNVNFYFFIIFFNIHMFYSSFCISELKKKVEELTFELKSSKEGHEKMETSLKEKISLLNHKKKQDTEKISDLEKIIEETKKEVHRLEIKCEDTDAMLNRELKTVKITFIMLLLFPFVKIIFFRVMKNFMRN